MVLRVVSSKHTPHHQDDELPTEGKTPNYRNFRSGWNKAKGNRSRDVVFVVALFLI